MTRKKREILTFTQKMKKLVAAGVGNSPSPARNVDDSDELPTLKERIDKMLGITFQLDRKPTNMLFFIMYDISSTKVRNQVVKYLLKKGCTRIQKSIFLADLDRSVYESIQSDLVEVQAAYENEDSILVVPFSTDYLKSMKIIGHSIEIDVITHNRNTMFF